MIKVENWLNTLSPSELDAKLSKYPALRLSKLNKVIILVDGALIDALKTSSTIVRTVISKRWPDTELVFVYFDFNTLKYIEARLDRSGQVSLNELADSAIAEFRKLNLEDISKQSIDLTVQYYPGFRFLAPSGNHCEFFFRTANLLNSLERIQSHGFWLLSVISKSDLIIMDTWSIAAPLLWASGKLAQKKSVAIDGFSVHPLSNYDEALRCIKNWINIIGPSDSITFVISVRSSGKLESIIKELCQRVNINEDCISFEYLYSLNNLTGRPESCNLPLIDPPETINLTKFHYSTKTLTIDPSLLYPRVTKEKRVSLKAKHFGLKAAKVSINGQSLRTFVDNFDFKDRQFISRLDKHRGTLLIHYNFEGYHFKTFIDTTPESFFQLVWDTIREKFNLNDQSYQFILCDNSEINRKFAVLVAEKLNIPVCDLDGVSNKSFSDARGLVVFAAMLTGSTIINFSSKIRSSIQSKNVHRLDYLVGLCRSSKLESEGVNNAISTGNSWSSEFLQGVILRPSSQENCPWCHEERILNEALRSNKDSKIGASIERRVTDLNHSFRGKEEKVLGFDSTLSVQGGSPVFPEGWSSMAVIHYIEIALESLRNDDNLDSKLSPGFLYSQCLNHSILRNYNEDLLRAAFLRAVDPSEWGSNLGKSFLNMLISWVSENMCDCLRYEICLFLRRGPIRGKDCQRVIKRLQETHDETNEVHRICKVICDLSL